LSSTITSVEALAATPLVQRALETTIGALQAIAIAMER
jgi:hypothetical protein